MKAKKTAKKTVKKTKVAEIKIFKVSDSEWVAARNSRDARKEFRETFGDDLNDELYKRIRPMTPAEMKKEQFYDIDNERQAGSFAKQLKKMIKEGESFPTMFATSEW